MQSVPSLEKAYQECEKLAFSHYENFPVASWLLPKETRPHIAALYAFARIADDFADEPRYEGKRRTLLDGWERNLKAALKGKKSGPALVAFAGTIQKFDIPLSLPLALLRAFRMDLVKHRWSSWNSLLDYCRHSADPVGRMVLWISGVRDPKTLRYSDFICSGLQLINFWQDSSIDLKKGRIYYPRQLLKKHGIREKDLLNDHDSPQVRRMVREAVDFTESYFHRGFPILGSVSGRLKWELKATVKGGQAILDRIRALDYNVLAHRPVLTGWDKLRIGASLFFP
ncbi:MAG TPA: squalene synthase HpnC [bacterium]|nr:squalene synthase HpnC [bacterium]